MRAGRKVNKLYAQWLAQTSHNATPAAGKGKQRERLNKRPFAFNLTRPAAVNEERSRAFLREEGGTSGGLRFAGRVLTTARSSTPFSPQHSRPCGRPTLPTNPAPPPLAAALPSIGELRIRGEVSDFEAGFSRFEISHELRCAEEEIN